MMYAIECDKIDMFYAMSTVNQSDSRWAHYMSWIGHKDILYIY